MKATLKNGLDWGIEFGIEMLDPDGFGERTENAPMFSDLMTAHIYLGCMRKSTCRTSHDSFPLVQEFMNQSNTKNGSL